MIMVKVGFIIGNTMTFYDLATTLYMYNEYIIPSSYSFPDLEFLSSFP